MEEIRKSYEEEGLTEEDYKDLSERLKALLEVYYNRMAERAEGKLAQSDKQQAGFSSTAGLCGSRC